MARSLMACRWALTSASRCLSGGTREDTRMLPRNGIWLISVLKLWGMVAGERTPGWEMSGSQCRDSVSILNRSRDFGPVLHVGPRSFGTEKGVGLVSEDSGVRKGAGRPCGRGASWSKDTDTGRPAPRWAQDCGDPSPGTPRGPEGPQGRPCRFGVGLLKPPPRAGGGVWEEGQEAAAITQVQAPGLALRVGPAALGSAAHEARGDPAAVPRR